MTEASLLIQLFYEIAMSIGTTLDLGSMLKTSLSTYLRKLNCSAGVVLRLKSNDNGGQSFEPVLSIPRNALRNAACRAAIDRVPENMSENLFRQFMESLPIVENSSPGKHYHIMRLPDFGLLVLVKSGLPFDYPILQSLKRLNAKLADSCLACLGKEKLERLNRRLVHEVSERRRAENDLKNVLEELESMVEARTSELSRANERLRGEIAERERTEKALSESERRYKSIFDNICDTFFAADENGVVTEITPSFERLSGLDRREILGRSFETCFKVFPGHLPFVLDLREKGGVRNMEMLLEDKDGARRICAVNARIVGDHEGETAGIVGSVRDLTEQRAAEIKNLRLEEKLARSQKMEALGLLAGGVAHDLNNLLSGVVSYPDLLLASIEPGSRLQKPLEVIRDSGIRASAVVQDMLTLARRGVVQKKAVHLNDVVEKYMRSPEIKNLMERHPDVRVVPDLQADLPYIRGAEFHLGKTVMNLVDNAVEAGGRNVSVTTKNLHLDRDLDGYEQVPRGDYAILEVHDDGVGISREDLARVFEPFYTKKAMGRSGTGLGMSVVWNTVHDHGGYIGIHSEIGKGTAFSLYFPVTGIKPEEACGAVGLEDLCGHGEKVLVIDDAETQRAVAGDMLRALGYQVDCVESGERALQYLGENKADILLLDMTMDPGMDGLDTYRSILKIRPGQKAVIASGYSETDRVKEALRLGTAIYVKKPYSLESIGMAIKKCLAGRVEV